MVVRLLRMWTRQSTVRRSRRARAKQRRKESKVCRNFCQSIHMCGLTCLQDEEQNGNQKRVSELSPRMEVAYVCLKPGTPTISPAKKQKKGKANRKKLALEKTVINVIFGSSDAPSRDWAAISSSWQRKFFVVFKVSILTLLFIS